MIEIITSYDLLVQRALDALDGAPYFKYVEQPTFARLDVDGDRATLRWPELEAGYYDSGDTIREESVEFDAAVLTMSAEAFRQWKQDSKTVYDRQQKEKQEAARKAEEVWREKQERAAYEALKRKYG